MARYSSPARLRRITWSFRQDSAYSASGSESFTIPHPAKSIARCFSSRAERHDKLAIAVQIDPAERTGVPAALQVLMLANKAQGSIRWRATDRRGGMQGMQSLQQGAPRQKLAYDRRLQMLDVFQAQEFGRIGHPDPGTEVRQGVAQHGDDNFMLAAILRAVQQFAAQAAILFRARPARGRTGQGGSMQFTFPRVHQRSEERRV